MLVHRLAGALLALMDRQRATGSVLRCVHFGDAKHCLSSIIELTSESMMSMQEAPEREELDLLVDSGASTTVVNDDMAMAVNAINVKPEVTYQMADGRRIPHQGENTFKAATNEGLVRHTTAQVESYMWFFDVMIFFLHVVISRVSC